MTTVPEREPARKVIHRKTFVYRRMAVAAEQHRRVGAAANTLRVLASHADFDGYCFVKYATIADQLGLSVSAVEKHVATLRRQGLIAATWRVPYGGSVFSCLRYVLDLAELGEEDALDAWAVVRRLLGAERAFSSLKVSPKHTVASLGLDPEAATDRRQLEDAWNGAAAALRRQDLRVSDPGEPPVCPDDGSSHPERLATRNSQAGPQGLEPRPRAREEAADQQPASAERAATSTGGPPHDRPTEGGHRRRLA